MGRCNEQPVSGKFCAILWSLAVFALLLRPASGQELPPIDTAQAVDQDLRQLMGVLTDAKVRQEQRDEAARRLMIRASGPVRQDFLALLISGSNREEWLALARAVPSATAPPEEQGFIAALFRLLGQDRVLSEAAVEALKCYQNNPRVLSDLIAWLQPDPRGPNRMAAQRAAAARALGAFANKAAAEALIGVLTRSGEEAGVQEAAAEALIDLTGLRDNDHETARWQDWWAANSGKSEERFKADLLPARVRQHQRLESDRERLAQETEAFLREQYNAASAGQQEMLLRFLRSSAPEIRIVGADLIPEDTVVHPPTLATKAQLRQMIGDSSAEVRLHVAKALSAVNDKDALEPLLAQLAQESDPQVRIALINALDPINDVRAVPQLLELLSKNNPSEAAAIAAAHALKTVGPVLHDKDPSLANAAAKALMTTINMRTRSGDSGLRDAAIRALGPLKDRDALLLLLQMLSRRETDVVRIAALDALGELGDSRAESQIVENALEDKNPAVRRAGVLALGTTATQASAEALYKRVKDDADEEVRTIAWRVVASLLPHYSDDLLLAWGNNRFNNEPERQEMILKTLVDGWTRRGRLEKDQQDSLAHVQENIGRALIKQKRPAQAAQYFRPALNYWRGRSDMLTQGLIKQLMQAYLQAGEYRNAITFAAEMIGDDRSNVGTMGPMIRDEAASLAKSSPEQAMSLIQEARNMVPSLEKTWLDELKRIEGEIRPSPATSTVQKP